MKALVILEVEEADRTGDLGEASGDTGEADK